jgi:hypothetical protein
VANDMVELPAVQKVAANFNTSPNHGADAQDENLELVDSYLLRVRHRAVLPHFGSFISPKNNRSS